MYAASSVMNNAALAYQSLQMPMTVRQPNVRSSVPQAISISDNTTALLSVPSSKRLAPPARACWPLVMVRSARRLRSRRRRHSTYARADRSYNHRWFHGSNARATTSPSGVCSVKSSATSTSAVRPRATRTTGTGREPKTPPMHPPSGPDSDHDVPVLNLRGHAPPPNRATGRLRCAASSLLPGGPRTRAESHELHGWCLTLPILGNRSHRRERQNGNDYTL